MTVQLVMRAGMIRSSGWCGFIVSGIIVHLTACLLVAASPAGVAGPVARALSSGSVRNDLCLPVSGSSQACSQADAAGRDVSTSVPIEVSTPVQADLLIPVQACKEPLLVDAGRSRLLSFPRGVRRTALSSVTAAEIVQTGPKEMLVLGKNPGVADLTVWTTGHDDQPAVIVIRVTGGSGPVNSR